MSTTSKPVFQSRFGFHPCSVETYAKLRFLNSVYQEALTRAAAWRRWERKWPKNRVSKKKIAAGYWEKTPMAEPEICLVFSERKVKSVTLKYFEYVCAGDKPLWTQNGDKMERPYLETHGPYILAAARQARKPCLTPEEVRELPLSEAQIEELYASAKERRDNSEENLGYNADSAD